MASDKFKVALFQLIINRLKGRGVGFGYKAVRPQSYYYCLEAEKFIQKVMNHINWHSNAVPEAVNRIEDEFDDLDEAPSTFLKDQPAFCEQLEKVTNYFDLYGGWVESLRQRNPPQDLRKCVGDWAKDHAPSDCLQQMQSHNAINSMVNALQNEIATYSYDKDFLTSWMIPTLARLMIDLVHEACRPNINPNALRLFLRSKTGNVMEALERDFGIYGLDIADLVERTLLLVISAPPEEYNLNRGAPEQWALAKLKEQIKKAIVFHLAPKMDMRDKWGLGAARQSPDLERMETSELRMREVWLRKFSDMVQEE